MSTLTKSLLPAWRSIMRAFASLLVATSAACGGGGDGGIVAPLPAALTGIQLAPADLSLIVGATGQVQALLQGAGASTGQGTIRFSSGSPSIAAVNELSGQITAISPGTAIITATGTHPATKALAAATVTATSQVTVSVPPNALTDMTVAPSPLSVFAGATAQLVATTTKANAAVTATCTFASSNTVLATVSATTGLVTALAPGSVVITATCNGTGTGVTPNQLVRTVTVTITEAPVGSIELTVPDEYLQPGPGDGRTSTTITAVVKNTLGTVLTRVVTWTSSVPAVATVSTAGLVTALNTGSTVVTASVDGVSRTATINVVRAFAVVEADQPTTAVYQSGTNSAGKPNTVVRTATGRYNVTFDGLGVSTIGRTFLYLVNADAGGPNASLASITAMCREVGGSAATPVSVSVRCEDPVTGADKDAAFRVIVIGDHALAGAHAFTLHSLGRTAPYTPNAFFSFNSAGAPMIITPNAQPGSFNDRVTRHNMGLTVPSQMAFAQVLGQLAGVTCHVRNQLLSSADVDVLCFDRLNFVVDASHQLLRLSAGRSGRVAGAALLSAANGAYVGQGFASSGSVVSTRTGVGKYTVTFPGLSAESGPLGVIASPWSTNDFMHCVHHVVSRSPVTIDIACISKTGAFSSTEVSGIQLLVLQ